MSSDTSCDEDSLSLLEKEAEDVVQNYYFLQSTMAPSPQERAGRVEDPVPVQGARERVVIAGMSGIYPESKHVKDLEDILYNKKNPVTSEGARWKFNHPEVTPCTGKAPHLDRFDAQFFKVHYRLANTMDAMGRKILEQAYQAIYDAGINPEDLSGKKVGVYTGSCFSETEKACFYVASSRTGFGIAGCSKSMFANRISYWLNAKGPSMALDDACCSSIAALEQAYLAIARGECEAAIVGGANLCLHPQSSLHYGRTIQMCMDGKTKSFDQNADGSAKSEAVNVLFLQKATDAKRIYAEVAHVKAEFTELVQGETGPKYGFYRDPMSMARFMQNFYKEANIPPQAVEYVEAFGSAMPDADKSELEAIQEVFCKGREVTLLVGSVMSNIGYGEAASGISAITKVLLGYQRGELAANLHCNTPRTDVSALRDGRMRIVTDHAKFHRTYTAVNGISITGVNAHVLLNGHYKPKDLNRYKCAMPRLVTISARQDTAVANIIEDLKKRPVDPEELALFHNIHQSKISGHLGRGYIILDTDEENETVSLSETVSYFDGAHRPLWFVYSGMGSQWAGMGTQLMRIPVFAAAIQRCHQVLTPLGVDIVNIITSPEKEIFNSILNSFVGIAAIQIGLTDILTALGIVPDKIIGHSVGELGCAYADGCFTAEEMILAAYSRGRVSVETPFIKGSMAAVGVGYQEIVKLLPPQIEVACHNGPESSTISGPSDVMKQFVAKLTAQGIFAKEVPCSNIAYHSRYIAEAGPGLLKYLKKVIKDPKPRSEKWLSTSVPEDKWGEDAAKYSSAEYHTNNLLGSVLFEETSSHIPPNAVLIEIAPHGLLQAILKRSLPESCVHIPMTRRGHQDSVLMVLDAIGKLYMEGYNPKVQAIYPQIEFPVSTGTPMLSHLVEWAHGEKWGLPLFVAAHRRTAASCKFAVSLHDDEYKYLNGHVIRGKTLYPFSAALIAAWDTLCMWLQVPRRQQPVTFRDVHLYAQPTLHDFRHLRLSVTLHRGTGRFEIMDEDRKVATGYIYAQLNDAVRRAYYMPFDISHNLTYDGNEVYQSLYERDYLYSDDFCSINKMNSLLTQAQIIWKNNWVTFLDGMLQMQAIRHKHETVSQPWHISQIAINLQKHFSEKTIETDGKTVMVANVFEEHKITVCGGVLLENLQFHDLPKLRDDVVALQALKFVPRFQFKTDIPNALKIYMQMVSENINEDIVKVLEITNSKEKTMLETTEYMKEEIPAVSVKCELINREHVLQNREKFLNGVDLVIVQNLSLDDNLCQTLYRVLKRDIFLINVEDSCEKRIRPSELYKVVSTIHANTTRLELIRWRPIQNISEATVMTVRSKSDISLLSATRPSLHPRRKLVILSTYPPIQGLKKLVKLWRKETDRNQIYLVMIPENDNLDELPDLDMAFNVLNNSVWGGEYYTTWDNKLLVDNGVALRIQKTGDFDSLFWEETPQSVQSGIPVTVHYAAINDFDIKRATGVLPFENQDNCSDTSFGMDFSGLTDCGQRVMGICYSGSVSGRVIVKPELLWPVPDDWNLEEAATVPSAYAHALYCLTSKSFFLSGSSVLVHGGSGALGQAVISIALSYGCTVFTTVSDVRKKTFLMKLFPQLQGDHIGNSRDESFGDMITVATKGTGVNIVFCCLKGELKDVSLKMAANSGITLDTTLIQSQEKYSFGMYLLTKERSYIPVDFSSIFRRNNTKELKKLQLLVSEGISRGYICPLTHMVFPPSDVARAFRLQAASKHRGRVLIQLRHATTTAQPRISCSPHLCHLVVSDQEALGLQLADRLISRGARKLRIHFNSPPVCMKMKTQSWKEMGVTFQISWDNLTTNREIISLLAESNQLGPVEGVYVVSSEKTTEESTENLNSVIVHLDLAARKICPSVRYFAVLSVGSTVGQQTCATRIRNGLPATALQLHSLRKPTDTSTTSISWRGAIDALERAIRSNQATVLAHVQSKPVETLLQQVANMTGIDISKDTMENVTLLDLGMESAKVPQICSFLKDVHNIALNEEDILNLSVEKIKELDLISNGSEYKEIRGLSTFFSYVDPDELLGTAEIVFLPTLSSSATTRDDEFDVSQTYLIVIPGMEGHHDRFRVICERLKLPALVLQPGLDFARETPKETALRNTQLLLKKDVIKKNYYLMGYESGVMVALEMAAILETLGITGTVFCVGGTPEEIKECLEEELAEYKTEEDLQNAVTTHMFSLMAGDTDALETALENNQPWKEKIENCVRMLLGRVAHSSQYARALIEGAYSRIKQVREYNSQIRGLKSNLVLLHATSHKMNEKEWHETAITTLQKYSSKPVAVEKLKATFANAVYDLRCSSIINKHLDSEILAAFENKNLCETYLLNADVFMGNSTENADVEE